MARVNSCQEPKWFRRLNNRVSCVPKLLVNIVGKDLDDAIVKILGKELPTDSK